MNLLLTLIVYVAFHVSATEINGTTITTNSNIQEVHSFVLSYPYVIPPANQLNATSIIEEYIESRLLSHKDDVNCKLFEDDFTKRFSQLPHTFLGPYETSLNMEAFQKKLSEIKCFDGFYLHYHDKNGNIVVVKIETPCVKKNEKHHFSSNSIIICTGSALLLMYLFHRYPIRFNFFNKI